MHGPSRGIIAVELGMNRLAQGEKPSNTLIGLCVATIFGAQSESESFCFGRLRSDGVGCGSMNDQANNTIRVGSMIDRSDRVSGTWRLIFLAFLVLGASVAFAFLPRDRDPFILGLLGVLAVVGVFSLFAWAIGLIRLAGRSTGSPIATSFIESLEEGVIITDRNGRIVFSNPAYSALVGASDDRDIRPVERIFAGEPSAAEAIYRVSQAVREGISAVEEVRVPTALDRSAGSGRWYRISVGPMAVNKGLGKLTVWRVSDVTEARQKQESVFLELQHAIDYLDHAPVGFFSAEADGRLVYINATLAEWLGFDLARFLPGSLKLADLARGAGAALLPSGEAPEGEGRTEIIDLDFVKQNGQSLPVRLLHRFARTADGTPGATRTIVLNRGPGEDVSEAVRAAEVRFTRFFNNTPIAIAALDGEGRIGRTNAPFATMFGSSKSGASGARQLIDFVRETDRPVLDEAINSANQGKGEIPSLSLVLAGPKERSARFFLSAVEEGGEEDERVIVYALDITDQRALEAQFAQSQKMQAVGQLAGGVAHDFNNVLTAIIGFSDLLLANHRPSDPSFQDIMNIKQNANRAAGLVRQLMAFSRRQTLRPQVLALADVLSEVSILLQRLLGENVKLQLVHGRDLWPIKADINQFEQVAINLAVNARDAMSDGGVLTIRTSNVAAADGAEGGHTGLPEGDYVLVEFEDTGSGIEEEHRGKIFEPFFSTKEVGKGTGLGLSTVYGIVQQTGGHIFFDSTIGRGTRFQIYLPRYVAGKEVVEDAAPEKVEEPTDLTGSGRILLVEDEEAVRAFAARALAGRGYTVEVAATGIEALEVMKKTDNQIDLVVSDVVMPEMDGPTLLRELRKVRPDLKIIFISGYAEDAFRKNLPEGEDFAFLPKPFSLKQLATAVKKSLAS